MYKGQQKSMESSRKEKGEEMNFLITARPEKECQAICKKSVIKIHSA
jgi:hypothetical protein